MQRHQVRNVSKNGSKRQKTPRNGLQRVSGAIYVLVSLIRLLYLVFILLSSMLIL